MEYHWALKNEHIATTWSKMNIYIQIYVYISVCALISLIYKKLNGHRDLSLLLHAYIGDDKEKKNKYFSPKDISLKSFKNY